MSFRRRITIASAGAVAIAVAIASLLTYVLVRNSLRGQVDASLRQRAGVYINHVTNPPPTLSPARAAALATLTGGRGGDQFLLGRGVDAAHSGQSQAGSPVLDRPNQARTGATGTTGTSGLLYRIPTNPGEGAGYSQVISSSGSAVKLPASEVTLPVSPKSREIARKGSGSLIVDATVDGQHLRILTVGFEPGHAVEVARPLAEVDSVLGNIRLILVLLTAGGIALAAVLGRFVAGAAVVPVRRLTDAAEHVAQTQDLSKRIEDAGPDELGRLATSFNSMLDVLEGTMAALDESARAQRQLVADASHELRTPVTSLRTNIEILEQADQLDEADRRRLIADVVEQLEELSALVGDLIELARDETRHEAPEEIRLDTLISEAVARAVLHAPTARFDVDLEETIVSGVPSRLDRAINNVLDNAVKFAGTEQPIEVHLVDGELTVRDHGPGIDAAELPHVFDRFYRGAKARALPGSGLGLAIVRQVIDLHGGSVAIERAAGGGTLARVRLPTA
ncbi:MAG TPA: HAMP domain-containing sensor histidine kinase [Solirubrobacteraceae bacterium]|nr:HAMP domain-containing sensor histidine kinase [Solirubrobacteraceae bacterium]